MNVIGIDICCQAIEDAKMNALVNGKFASVLYLPNICLHDAWFCDVLCSFFMLRYACYNIGISYPEIPTRK
jgi:hypothetical protein